MTQLFIETPYRNPALCADLLSTLSSSTQLCIARDLTGDREYVQTKCVSEWRKQTLAVEKHPTMFLFLAKSSRP